jgi:hypothetical protein
VAPNWKPSRTARKAAERQTKKDRKAHEDREKKKVRLRDKGCRFPLCGCKKLGRRLEVSHYIHKGMGGNPSGDRSLEPLMVQLCVDRHQFSNVSMHKGTLRPVFLTDENFNGPIAWEVNISALYTAPDKFTEVARESSIGRWEEFTDRNRAVLTILSALDC